MRVADRFSSRDNAFGLLRLILASAVIVSHAFPLSGHGSSEFMTRLSGGQVTLGELAVAGFFIVSGFLVTRSALTSPARRYVWKRFLRIFPGFWACLLVTAFVFAPLTWLYERGLTEGFLGHTRGPFSYLRLDAFIGMRQYDISGLLAHTPYAKERGIGVFNGSLWTLIYEVSCYVAIALLAATLLKRAPRATAIGLAVLFYVSAVVLVRRGMHPTVALPLVGRIDAYWAAIWGLCFVLGGVYETFRRSIIICREIAAVAMIALLAALRLGDYVAVGIPALSYVLIWAAVALPKLLHGVGRKNDYSYGVYIYAFPVQQALADVGVAGWGLPLYCLTTFLFTIPLAMLSWHLVEKRAMALRNITTLRESRPEVQAQI